jgi:hypothetical protein
MTRDELLLTGCGTEIADDAIIHGYEPRYLADNGKSGDHRLTLWDCNGCRVVQTNGGDVWEESDPEGFAELVDLIDPDPDATT